MPDIKPLVFIVDDDVSVRESLELLIHHEGWQPETYSTADDFLKRLPALVPSWGIQTKVNAIPGGS
jgi:FixJ family two-component response regulator